MWNPCRPKMKGERTKLPILSSVTFSVKPFHEYCKEWEFVGMGVELSGRRVAQVGKNRIALFPTALNCAVESPRSQRLLTVSLCHSSFSQVVFVLDLLLPESLA